ncbi:CDP-glycerol glycerophosphotransferase family protein [Helicobacter anatolicus]|uniref:CDP-glycerol glycerophosphotransferase family protein n=1 Tax=Helicobacter anatolicus TaxID=2905874 RepID=UPI001E53176A|nr:CDP-glycerol glycerophosphotransferase family protein [Helicobacter anatolicus]MCE3038238.1 CDP-glycerol glycerophosphotransferase family protein [Helicobacter anatolicus]
MTSDSNDLAFLRKNKNKVRFIGKGNLAYSFLNTLRADIVVMTTPGLDVLEIKRSKGVEHYCHIVHSLGSPNYRAFGMDYYDSILINATMQADFINQVTKAHHVKEKIIKIIGSPYCDMLNHLKNTLQENVQKKVFFPNKDCKNKTILLSPSWGKEGALAKYGMELIDAILKAGFYLIIRPHPQSLISEKELITTLQDKASHEQVVWDIDTPNVYAMEQSDVMISDFSGIIFDYICLYNKPVLTLDFEFDHSGYDSADIDLMWEFSIFDHIGGRINKKDFAQIKNLIFEACVEDKYQEALQEVKKSLWTHVGESGEIGAKAILEIRQKILEQRLGKYYEFAQEFLQIQKILEGVK